MPLTPADVHNVAFKKPSIGKRGYDEDEVDAFLDVVEAELARLIEENAELKSQDRVGSRGGQTVPLTKAAGAPMSTGEAHIRGGPAARVGAGDRGQADREARAEAEQVTGEANAEAEKTVTDAKSQAEALLSDADRPRRGRRAGQPHQGGEPGPRGQEPLRRDPGQAGHRAGRAGEEDRGPARIREGVPRPAQELDQRSARPARRRRFPRAAARSPSPPAPATDRTPEYPLGPAALRWIRLDSALKTHHATRTIGTRTNRH